MHNWFQELRLEDTILPNGQPLPDLFNFTDEERGSTTPDVIK